MFYAIIELGDKYVETCADCPLCDSCQAYKDWAKELDNAVLPCNTEACMIREIVDA